MDWRLSRPPGHEGRGRRPRRTSRSTRRRRPRASRSTRSRRTCPVDVAVVAQLDVDTVLQARRADPLASPARAVPSRSSWTSRGSHARRPRTGRTRPSRSRSRGRAGRRPGRPRRPSAVLGPLGVGERLVGRVEHGARVGHRLVEERLVEGVAQVVVGRDVLRLWAFVFRRSRWASVRRSWAGARNQPADSASDSRLSAAQRSRPARSGLDHRPSTYASPPPVSPSTRSLVRARRSWMWISAVGPAVGSPNVRRLPSGRTTTRCPTATRSAAAVAIRQAIRDRMGSAKPGGVADGRRCGHRVASPCRWNRAPRSHSRRACQWIMPIVRWLTIGWRTSMRRTIRSDRRRRVRSRLVCRRRPSVLGFVDRDPETGRLVADPDRVAPGHLDERRDVERLVHRVHEGAGASRRRGARTGGARRGCCGPRR